MPAYGRVPRYTNDRFGVANLQWQLAGAELCGIIEFNVPTADVQVTDESRAGFCNQAADQLTRITNHASKVS